MQFTMSKETGGCMLERRSYMTSLSSERDGSMRLTATGVPRQQAFKISPNEPCKSQLSSSAEEHSCCFRGSVSSLLVNYLGIVLFLFFELPSLIPFLAYFQLSRRKLFLRLWVYCNQSLYLLARIRVPIFGSP